MSVAPVVCSARARRTVSSSPCTPGAPRRRLDTCALAHPAASTPRVCSTVPARSRVTTPGYPVPGGCVGGGARPHRPVAPR
eukprot:28446-Prymnesium_polylepis.1